MKKLFAILLTLALMLTGAAALAEAAAAAQTVDFGDFTLTIPEGYMHEVGAKSANEVFFYVYGAPDAEGFTANMNGVWNDAYEDLSTLDMADVKQEIHDQITAAVANQTQLKIDNLDMSDPFLDKLGGKTAIVAPYVYTADYSGMGVDLQMDLAVIQLLVSDEALGTYTFTVTGGAEDQDAMTALCQILDSIVWKG